MVDRRILDETERDETPDTIRAKLEQRIEHIEDKGYHNQFNFPNYGVQYSDIYDKETQRVKSISETNLSPEEYINKVKLMYEAPELTEEWNVNRISNIAKNTFETLFPNYWGKGYSKETVDKVRDKFTQLYLEKTKKYFMDDENFDYQVIMSLFEDALEYDYT